jgi:predicted DNA-binding ribbon-helix-helix protein
MKSSVVKRSIVIGGHKTSVSLEEPFWTALKEIAVQRGATLSQLVKDIDVAREHSNLSSAIRLFVLAAYQNEITDASDPQREGRSAHEIAA